MDITFADSVNRYPQNHVGHTDSAAPTWVSHAYICDAHVKIVLGKSLVCMHVEW